MHIKEKSLLGVLISIIALSYMLLNNVGYLLVSIVFLTLLTLFFLSENFEKNIFFIAFITSFFIFLVSGDLVNQLTGKEYWMTFSEATNIHAHFCLLLSLIFLVLGYLMTQKSKIRFLGGNKNEDNYYIVSIRQASKILFYFALFPYSAEIIFKSYISMVYGYDAIYLNYESFMPIMLLKIGNYAPAFLCMFLATLPSKREVNPLIYLFAFTSFLAIFSGNRGSLIYNIVFIFAYYIYRNKYYNDGTTWISKRTLFLLALSLPTLFVTLLIIQYWRENVDIVYVSFYDMLLSFFVAVGNSSKVIKLAYDYQDYLSEFKFYSFGTFINYLKEGILFSFFTDNNLGEMHSASYALNGNKLDPIITYLHTPAFYFRGGGHGSCYIAELFVDFGYLGVAVGSFIFGWLFKKCSNLSSFDVIANYLKLYIMLNMIRVPRSEYSRPFSAIVNILHLVMLFILFVLTNYYYVKYTKIRQSYN